MCRNWIWEGDTLVFTTRIVESGGESINIVRYRLLNAGRLLQAQERFRGPQLSYDNLWVLARHAPHAVP